MPLLTDYLSRRGEYLVLILVVVLSVTLMLLSATEKDVVVRAINDTAFTPVQILLSSGRGVMALKTENDSLRTELARATLTLAHLEEGAREAERLRALLEVRERSLYDVVTSRVMAREAGRPGREYKIDRGSKHGIRKDLAVVTFDGLVGRVTAVEPRSAYVRPLLTRNCRVSARLLRTRTDGILEWTSDLGLHLTFLPFRAEVKPGDEVVSSGLGGIFPPGIVIGKAASVETVPSDGTVRVRVEPAVNFSAIEEVFVVVGLASGDFASREPRWPPEPAAAEEPSAEPDSAGTAASGQATSDAGQDAAGAADPPAGTSPAPATETSRPLETGEES